MALAAWLGLCEKPGTMIAWRHDSEDRGGFDGATHRSVARS